MSENPTTKKVWPDAQLFPADAIPVPGISAARRAYQYTHPKYGPTYVCKVEFSEIPMVERIKQEVELETGREVKTRNIKFKNPETKSDEWWMGCPLAFLRRLDSWQPTAEEISAPIVPPPELPKTAQKKSECIANIQSQIDRMEEIIKTQLEMVATGDYLPFGKPAEEITLELRMQRAALKALRAQFQSALLVCLAEI